MFEHSVRVPRHFKIAANIVKKVSEEGGSVKTLLYDSKLKHFRTSVLYALINESIKNSASIDKIFENTGILVNEPRLDRWLAKVLTAELLYGKKTLPGNSKPEQTILSYKERFEQFTTELQDNPKSKVVRRPRYVRINTNLLTTSDAIRAFQDESYKFIRCTSGSYNDYLQQIQNLSEYDFTQDYHVKTIFVFPPGTKLHGHDLYLENKIILQDKATALAVHLLAAPAGSVVLDMCAAPGMKTTQLAAYLRNQGKIYAVERNEDRYATLCQYVEATGSKCVETLHKDSLEIRRGDMDDVEYILLDPSCSGSGMELSVHNYIEQTRLAKLTSLQEKFLKHAMNSFPSAKRIVYSTCSIFPEENERVVTNIVKASRAKWRVKDIRELLKEQWNNFGSGMYGSIGTRCLYAKPDSDYTIGFFLAILDRDFDSDKNKNPVDNDKTNDEKCKNKKCKENKEIKIDQHEEEENHDATQCQKTKKKKHGNLSNSIEHNTTNSDVSHEIIPENNLNLEDKKLGYCGETDAEEKCEFAKSKKKKHKNKSKQVMRQEDFKETIATDTINANVENTHEQKIKDYPSDVIEDGTTKKKLRNKDGSEDLEISENDKLCENDTVEVVLKRKKKKKHRAQDKEIEEHWTNIKSIPLHEENMIPKTKKKKRKERDNEIDNSSTLIEILSNDEDYPSSKKMKGNNCSVQLSRPSSTKPEVIELDTTFENEKEKSSEDVEIFENNNFNITSNDKELKVKKKKHKQRDTEDHVTQSFDTVDLCNYRETVHKKSKKQIGMDKSDTSLDLEYSEATMEKDDSINIEISVNNESYELPKKKKKKT